MRIPILRPALQVGVRLASALSLAGALPLSHALWGERYAGDGQQAFGLLIVMGIISSGVALAFVLVGSTVQFATRKYRDNRATSIDVLIWALAIGLMVYGGVNARYD
jgi:hypothetical protein